MNVSEEERARNHAEHEVAAARATATPHAAKASPALLWVLGALITGLFGYVLWSMAAAGEFGSKQPPAVNTPAPGQFSRLVGETLPGLTSFQGDSVGEAIEAGQEVARKLNMTCTTDTELFGVSGEITAFDALNAALTRQGYATRNLLDEGESTSFVANGPSDLFGIMHAQALFLCAY